MVCKSALSSTDRSSTDTSAEHLHLTHDTRRTALGRAAGAPELDTKPILLLCYNESLAVKLAVIMDAKGLSDRVHVRNFHKWCRQQLVAYVLSPTLNCPRGRLPLTHLGPDGRTARHNDPISGS